MRSPAVLGLIALAVIAGGRSEAEESVVEAPAPAGPPAMQPGPVALPTPRPDASQALDLRLGDVRRYVPAREWTAPLPEQLEDVEVVGRPGTPDMVETRPVPMGLGALFFAVRHPTQIWRIFVPDPNFQLPEEDRSNK